MSRSLLSVYFGLMAVLVLGGGLAACGSLPVTEPPRPTVAAPLWNEGALREHLRFFNGADVEGRATGTAGFATAASYVAAQMAEYNLQPTRHSSFQRLYPIPLVEPTFASLSGTAGDTLHLEAGVDYIPDGRSDAGQAFLQELHLVPASHVSDVAVSPGVLLPQRQASTDRLQALQAAGAGVVFSVGPLAPKRAALPVAGLLVVQITPRAAARLLGLSMSRLLDQFNQDMPSRHTLSRPINVVVGAKVIPQGEGINVMGYVAGKHPARSDELVLVCADLDNLGLFAGLRTLDAAHLGIGAAALLEVAQLYALVSRYTLTPERTVLFAVFSGARQNYRGLHEYLRTPLWPLDKTRSVIYLGLDPEDTDQVRALLAAHQIPLHVVQPPSDSLKQEAALLLPMEGPAEPMRQSHLMTAGALQARAMAEAAHALMLQETVGPTQTPARSAAPRFSSDGDLPR